MFPCIWWSPHWLIFGVVGEREPSNCALEEPGASGGTGGQGDAGWCGTHWLQGIQHVVSSWELLDLQKMPRGAKAPRQLCQQSAGTELLLLEGTVGNPLSCSASPSVTQVSCWWKRKERVIHPQPIPILHTGMAAASPCEDGRS